MSSITRTSTSTGQTRWRVRYRNPAGASKERWFDRKVDGERFARTIEVDKDRGAYVDPNAGHVKLNEWAEQWMATKAGKKPKTLASYRELLKTLVIPRFGPMALTAIRPSDVKAWLATLAERGLSASRIRQAFFVLSGLLGAALDDDLIRRNPASAAVSLLPPPPPRRDIFLSAEEIDRLASAAGEPWKVLIYTMGYAGLRWGEAAGLRRSGCAILRRRLHVVEAVSEVGGRLLVVGPKSARSARWVIIPAFLAEMLAEHLAFRVGSEEGAWVFTAPGGGGPVRYSNFRERVFKPAVEAAGLSTSFSIHHLRHSAAALMIREGAHMELVRDQLGHSSVSTTQRYAHLYPGAAEEVAARLDRSFREMRCGVAVGLAASRKAVAGA